MCILSTVGTQENHTSNVFHHHPTLVYSKQSNCLKFIDIHLYKVASYAINHHILSKENRKYGGKLHIVFMLRTHRGRNGWRRKGTCPRRHESGGKCPIKFSITAIGMETPFQMYLLIAPLTKKFDLFSEWFRGKLEYLVLI